MTASFVDLVDLASERLGGAAVAANDEFFAAKENLIKAAAPVWRDGEYTDRGKWMDGWETRRRRDLGPDAHDWCLIRLGARGVVRGVDVDTATFTGNYPESCAIDACDLSGLPALDDLTRAAWREILPRTALAGDTHNLIAVDGGTAATHLRLRIFPDGGVARLRVHGDVVADWAGLRRQGDVDLAAVEHGGIVVACSDMFFGSRHNLIMPGDATHMGDGWETQRRRGPGHDWTIIRLGAEGTVRRVSVDTRHFKGNAPGACSLEALRLADGALAQGQALFDQAWRELLPRTPLQPHARHAFEEELRAIGDVTHVRFNIFPDGGVGRLRVYGRPT
ncbi:MAG: allantoicase [Acidobacteriia bacterium]|nr:allantoicase [Terriglobia bacterium]